MENIFYELSFDNEDSYVDYGMCFYFRNKEHILPFVLNEIKESRKDIEWRIKCDYDMTFEEYLEWVVEHPCWYISRIRLED